MSTKDNLWKPFSLFSMGSFTNNSWVFKVNHQWVGDLRFDYIFNYITLLTIRKTAPKSVAFILTSRSFGTKKKFKMFCLNYILIYTVIAFPNYLLRNDLGPSWPWLIGFLNFQIPVQSVHITTKVVSLNLAHCEMHSIQHYAIKFVGGFLWFPPPIKLTATI